MSEQEIRNETINYVEQHGIKYVYLATKIGVHKSTLCHFLKNDRKVANKVKIGLEQFLSKPSN
ncbi:hypothetical protein [Clostridium scatologenes]|uniref:hypothetical protein n=1 Tax=Clostridium scatologenes TaxID=1548 RepID=UPI00049047A6|nr:hypothetical protein [Clostridium scatologenes]